MQPLLTSVKKSDASPEMLAICEKHCVRQSDEWFWIPQALARGVRIAKPDTAVPTSPCAGCGGGVKIEKLGRPGGADAILLE